MEFTVFQVVSLPPWPPPRRVVIAKVPVSAGAGGVELVGHVDGHVEVVVRDAGAPSGLHLSRITRSEEARWCIICITQAANEPVRLYINGGEPLKLLSEMGEKEVPVPEGGTPPMDRSYDDPTAAEECASRMASRQSRMALVEGRAVRPGRRLKTAEEELADLEAEIAGLDHDLERARQGLSVAIGGVAGHIRALTYWPNDRGTWNPLLLRMAARLDLPLPVYVEPAGELAEAGVPQPDQHVRNLQLSCQRLRPTFGIVDLEEYLDRTLETVTTEQGETHVGVGQAVAHVGSAGHAHYDRDVEEYVDRLRALKYLDIAALDRLIVKVGETVLELARWVAMRLREAT